MSTDPTPDLVTAVRRARAEGAIEALRSAAEHVRLGAAVGPIPLDVRPAVGAWLCRLAEQRLDRARREAADRLHRELRGLGGHEEEQAPPVDRAAVLREAADRLNSLDPSEIPLVGHHAVGVAVALLRRMAAETPQPDTEARPTPRRGDAVEQWLKTQRNISTSWSAWRELDYLLDRYRLHADTGTPLGEHVCEGKAVGDCDCLEQPETETQVPDGRCPACGHTVCDGDGPCGARSGNDFCTCSGPAAGAQHAEAGQ